MSYVPLTKSQVDEWRKAFKDGSLKARGGGKNCDCRWCKEKREFEEKIKNE